MSVMVLDAGNSIIKAKIFRREQGEIAFPHALKLLTESEYKNILNRAGKAGPPLAYFREHGCIPFYGYAKESGSKDIGPCKTDGNEAGSKDDPSWCPIHEVEMRSWEKDGRVWFSHKADNGTWCSGKVKNGKNG